MNDFWIVVRNILVSVPFIILNVYLVCLVEERGFARSQSKTFFIFLTMIIVLCISIINPGIHWLVYVIYPFFGVFLATLRFELWFSFTKGKWWWLKDDVGIDDRNV